MFLNCNLEKQFAVCVTLTFEKQFAVCTTLTFDSSYSNTASACGRFVKKKLRYGKH